MRKHLLLLGATLVGGVLFAQPRVIGTHPAHDGKMLTMENAIVGRLSPENRYYSWTGENEYMFMDGRKMMKATIVMQGKDNAVMKIDDRDEASRLNRISMPPYIRRMLATTKLE